LTIIFFCSNDGAIQYVNPVLANAKSTDERVRARETQILSNISETKFNDAVHNSLLILQELGLDFSNADTATMKTELVKTQSLIEASSSNGQNLLEKILAKPTSIDSRQIGLMRILSCASRAAYVAEPPLMLLMVLRMVQMTLVSDAITAESSFGFAGLSFAMSGLGNHNLSYLASKVASALDDRFDKKYTCSVNCLINIGSVGYFQPMQAIIESFRQSLKHALSVGDWDWARISIIQQSPVAIGAPERGKTLGDVENEIRQVLMVFSSQEDGLKNNLVVSILYLQMLLNLKEDNAIGDADVIDPTVLTGAVMNQQEYLRRCEEEGVRDYIRRFYSCRLYLAYLFHQHSLAEDMVNKCEEVAQLAKFCPFFEIITETFYMGLIAAEALQQRTGVDSASDIERWQQLAMNSLNTMTKWADEGSEWNFSHKAALLRAEIAVGTGDIDTAVSSFQSAIMGARNSCYVNEEALSCERAGIFHASRGDMEEARVHLRRAQSLYDLWGARRKALDVSQLIVDYCTN
jgi:histidine kinase